MDMKVACVCAREKGIRMTKRRIIEIPSDGVVCVPIMYGEETVGERRVDLSYYPVIDAAPVTHAKWIQAPGSLHDYCCSRCMGFAPLGMFGDYNSRTNYCPNCGAKMDLE